MFAWKHSIESESGHIQMSINLDLLEILSRYGEKNSPEYLLYLNDDTVQITNVTITNSTVPINEPTIRGGVYFSDKSAYKMRGVIKDLLAAPLLTDKMLGPNTEFAEIKISTQIKVDGATMNLEIFTNLTNTVQTLDSIELNMVIVRIESV